MIYTYTRPAIIAVVLFLLQFTTNAQKRIYVANDDHTDYMWSATVAGYDSAFVQMLDWWLDYNDQTKTEHPSNYNLQSKWTCDGSLWVARYKKFRSAAQFNRLINQIKSGQVTVPYSPLISTYGGVPAEAVLRGMYYAGDMERTYNIDLDMASSMENQTMPLGLASLWKGAGAKYCWYGVCDCYTSITNLTNRQKQLYWYKGLDTNKILLKWYNLANPTQGYFVGGYAEARDEENAIDYLAAKANTAGSYPYNIVGGFGVGWDDLQTMGDDLVDAAIAKTVPGVQDVIVSNEVDFFHDVENNYGASLPSVTETYGNEWDLSCASIAEVSARVKRSLEKLRSAEAMAAIVTNYSPVFAGSLDSLRKEAWTALGLYWEHDFGFAGNAVTLDERNAYERSLEATFTSYVDQLYNLARSNLSNLITNDVPANTRFFAFNPLGWKRTNYADYAYSSASPLHVMDVNSGAEVPCQTLTKNGTNYLRILADSVPSVGYKVYEIQLGATSFPSTWYTTGTNAGFNFVESDSFKVTYSNQGVIRSIIDKHNGNKEIVATGGFLNDLGTGGANSGSATTSVENSGPVSVTIVTSTTTAPAHTTRITLFKNISRIEIDNQITQNFSSTKTWTYSFNITSPTIWHEETGAVIKAKLTTNATNPGHYAAQNARYDWSTLNHFASVNETNYGVSLSNQDCYFMKIGASTTSFLDQNSAQLNVLAGGRISATGDGSNPLGITNQGGDAVFNQRFAITTHTTYSAAAEMKKALEHQDSMVCGSVYNPVNFLLPPVYSFVNTTNPNSVIWALKPAEEGFDRGTITRVWNLGDADVSADLNYNLKLTSGYNTTHVETDISSYNFSPNTQYNLPVSIGHNEMKTFRVKMAVIPLAIKAAVDLDGSKISESNVLNWKNSSEGDLKTYELERSPNGLQFTKIAAITARGGLNNSYAYTDKSLDIATPYYYRLKMLGIDRVLGYSNTVLIKAAPEASKIILYPNPALEVLKANFVLEKQTRCQVKIYNTKGELVKTFAPPLFEKGNNYYTVSIKDLPAGDYIFTIIASDKKYVKNFIKE